MEILTRLANSEIKGYLVTPPERGLLLQLLSLRLLGGFIKTPNGDVVMLTHRAQWMFERVPWDKWKN